jgi:chromate transporter
VPAITEKTAIQPEPVSFSDAFLYWLKLGFISFGGPAGQISMMHQELVEKRRWISEHRFLHALNYTMVLPGPEAQQLATYIGWLMHGVWGGIAAGVLFVIPSLFILIALTWIYLVYGDVPAVEGILYGIKPAVTAIVVFAAYRIGSRALRNNVLRAMAVLAFIAIFALKIPFPYIVLMAGIIGYAGSHIVPDKFRAGGHHGSSQDSYGPALIDDDTPIPAHARFKWSRLIAFACVGVFIGAAVMAMLINTYGWEGTLTQMGWFFTKAALVTFGGAYAVLPYVYQGGVEQYAWLTGTQMIDGLVEATRGDVKFTAPLTGITAAVVGVVLNLATFFAYHVLWPQGFDAPFEWFSAVIGAAAFVALFKYKVGIVTVIGACAAVGLGYSLLL